MLDPENRRVLLGIARQTIEAAHPAAQLRTGDVDVPVLLHKHRASFVTLKTNGDLRGCIGTLEPVRPLHADVAHNAYAAAFRDPRFMPVTPDEVAQLEIEISVLDSPEPIEVAGYRDLLAQLRPAVDGLIVEAGRRRATFLPSVWDTLPDPEDFVSHLWKKAGLAFAAWPSGIRVLRYGAQHFAESGAGT
ncbi:MAG TPA: AmmeMemoRadiSam system protein A [Gammaproteobacteria bacterium]|nr:AmmeMemoRadiSam system protein A [Gammaproteobacteria bacterium]